MRTPTESDHERGFSLIELLAAMLITLIVTGAIYGLLAQGQNAFRREPEISDRQQQIRVAMDLIQRDIVTAGMSLPAFVQAFRPNLEGQGPPNALGVATDHLELIGYDGACAPLALCTGGGPTDVVDPPGACYRFPCVGVGCPLVAFRPGIGGAASIYVATGTAAPAACPNPGAVSVTLGAPVGNVPPPPVVLGADDLKPVQIVRYEIALDANGIPSLWRSARGGLDATPAYVPAPNGGSDWQLVATGIEDLQVQYRTGLGLPGVTPWLNGNEVPGITITPPALPQPTDPGDWAMITREVRVTLTARTTGQVNLQGESVSAAGVRAIRGSLTTVTAPRAALMVLSVGPRAIPPPPSDQLWQ